MQVLTGTKREITINQWKEQIKRYKKRADESMVCFERFLDADSLDRLIEDCEKIIETSRHAKKAIEYMDAKWNIKHFEQHTSEEE